MPVYVYKNLTTGDTFEITQRITEDALTHDPTTGDPVRRVIQPVGIAFKGSGFYVNDNRGSAKSTVGGANGRNGAPDAAAPDAGAKAPASSAADGGAKAANAAPSKSAGAAAD
jgi:predicted nucleic acid-binding Zn ribbon protein